MRHARWLACVGALVLAGGAGWLHQVAQVGNLVVSGAWTRANDGKAPAPVFLDIDNIGGMSDRLIGAEAEVAGGAKLMRSADDAASTKGTLLQAIDVEAHAVTRLDPGGTHITLIALKRPLVPGGTIPVTLRFEKSGRLTVDVAVRSANAKGDTGGLNAGHKPPKQGRRHAGS